MRDECAPRGRKSLRLGGCGRRQVAAGSRFAFLTQKPMNLRVLLFLREMSPYSCSRGTNVTFWWIIGRSDFYGAELASSSLISSAGAHICFWAREIYQFQQPLCGFTPSSCCENGVACMQHELLWHLSAAAQIVTSFLVCRRFKLHLVQKETTFFTYKP